MTADYLHWQLQYSRRIADLAVAFDTDDTTILTARSANHTIFVQMISVDLTTYSAVTWLFKDTKSPTPVPIGFMSIPANAVALKSESGSIIFDFGPTGFPLTKGKNLVLDVSATGAAGYIHVEAYERIADGLALAAANTN